MTLADRMAVMDRGEVRQVGTPREIYEYPASRFVAGFIGTITTFAATVTAVKGEEARIDVPDLGGEVMARAVAGLVPGGAVTLAIRPEKIALSRGRPEGENAFAGRIRDLAYLGKESLYRVELPTGKLVLVHGTNAARGAGSATLPAWGEAVWLSFVPAAAILLPGETP